MEATRNASEERQAGIAILLSAVIDQETWDTRPSPNLRASLRQVVEEAARPQRTFNTAKEMIDSIVKCANARREIHSWRKHVPMSPAMKGLIDYLAEQMAKEYFEKLSKQAVAREENEAGSNS
jgi:hypothetical protein